MYMYITCLAYHVHNMYACRVYMYMYMYMCVRMHLQESVQLEEHEMELVKVCLEDVTVVIVVHDLYQDCKRLLVRYFLWKI